MVETSRTLLFTKYARSDCGVVHTQGTDPKVWDNLPVSVVNHSDIVVRSCLIISL